MEIKEVAIGRVRVNPHNSKSHPDEQIEVLAGLIRDYGWTFPLLVDESNVLLAGEGRLKAAQLLGKRKVPVLVARGWTDDQKRAYVIADNKIAQNGKWNPEALSREIAHLKSVGIDIKTIGFSIEDIARLDEDLFRIQMTEESSGASTDADRSPSTGARTEGSGSSTEDGMLLSFMVADNEQRDTVLRAIRKNQEATGARLQGAALYNICKEYLR